MFNRKGSGSVGGLLILMVVLIILYTLVLPPCDKCKLLNPGSCSDVCIDELEERVLLEESPGQIGELSDEVMEHTLDSTELFIKEEPRIRELSDSLEIKNWLFGESDQELEFSIDDLENLDKISLSFSVLKAKGNLIITLNEKQIMNKKISVNKIEIIDLPIEYLDKNNKIRLQVSPAGAAFWSSNGYYLKDVELREKFELSHSSEILKFSISSSEVDAIEDSELSFHVFCKGVAGKSNILRVYLNDKMAFSEMISCISDDYDVELDEEDFVRGVNELKFSITEGEYLISDVEIKNEVSGNVYPSYVFYISTEVYDKANSFYLNLRSGDNKRAEIIVNDDSLDLDTTNSFIEYDITNMIRKGNNFIEIRPDNEFRVDELKVGYEI